MNKTASPLAICLAVCLTGCASTTSTSTSLMVSTVPTRDTLSIVQSSSKGKSDFYFCDAVDTSCPVRSLKVVAVPPQQPKPVAVISPPESPPKVFKVHFRWGWANLDSDGRRDLDSILKAVDNDSIREITIQGRTDPTGSRKFNEKLAQRRAELVKKELVEAGIRPEIIVAKAHLPCCNGSLSASKQEMREKRRADLEITIRTIKPK